MNLIQQAFFKLILNRAVSIEEAKDFLSLYEDYEERCLEILNEYIDRIEVKKPREVLLIKKAI